MSGTDVTHVCLLSTLHVEIRYVYWAFVGALFKDKAHQVLQLYGPLAEACEVRVCSNFPKARGAIPYQTEDYIFQNLCFFSLSNSYCHIVAVGGFKY